MSKCNSQFMLRALELARDYDGFTGPNPSVGAVIVKDDRILSEGVHKGPGRDHAEVVAIKKAIRHWGRDALQGSEIYITLEPCSSWGRTPPCTDALKESGIHRVIIGCWDPNPVNHKRSLYLRKAGIQVYRLKSKLADEIEKFYRPFAVFIRQKRPYVIVKIAQSLDGRVADEKGQSKWITDETIRREVHRRLRSRVDAIITGIGTIVEDDPMFTIRTGKKIISRRSVPLFRIILDSDLRMPAKARVIETAGKEYPVWLFVSDSISPGRINSFLSRIGDKAQFVQITPVKRKKKGLELSNVLRELARAGISRILLEAGPRLVASFLEERAVDRMIMCMSASFLGAGQLGIEISGLDINARLWLKEFQVEKIGSDLWIEGDVHWDS